MKDYFELTRMKVDDCLVEIKACDGKFNQMRDVMLNFRKDLTEYYDFFVAQAEKFLEEMA